MTTYVLAGGCFWCLDAVYRRMKGVESVVSGYSGGDIQNPTYEQVCTGETGHAESIKLTFDETIIPAATVLDIYFLIHDPTTLNRQGNDVGTQYRSEMFAANDEQRLAFEAALKRAKEHWGDEIVTKISTLDTFYPADDGHQDYFNKNPETGYCSVVIAPKIVKARAAFRKWFKEDSL